MTATDLDLRAELAALTREEARLDRAQLDARVTAFAEPLSVELAEASAHATAEWAQFVADALCRIGEIVSSDTDKEIRESARWLFEWMSANLNHARVAETYVGRWRREAAIFAHDLLEIRALPEVAPRRPRNREASPARPSCGDPLAASDRPRPPSDSSRCSWRARRRR